MDGVTGTAVTVAGATDGATGAGAAVWAHESAGHAKTARTDRMKRRALVMTDLPLFCPYRPRPHLKVAVTPNRVDP